MLRVLLPVLTIASLLMVAPASAIPVCPSGTMADYIGFGQEGCQFNSLTFSDFSYSGGVRALSGTPGDFFGFPIVPSPPPSAISAQPRGDTATFGSGGAALRFSPLVGDYWSGVNIGFNVSGPIIIRNELSAGLRSVANLDFGQLNESAQPGGFLGLKEGSICFDNPADNFPPNPSCGSFRSLSISPTSFQEVDISGFNVTGLEAGFATPEPATLLLVGTGAAGLGLARWVKRRRSRGYDHESSNIP